MSTIDFDEAIRICKVVRKDLEELLILCERSEFADYLLEIDFSSKVGNTPSEMLLELDALIGFLETRDAGAIDKRDWSIFELVNYYDMLIATMRPKEGIEGQVGRDYFMKRRNMAGKLAQFVCQIGDD